MMLNSKTHDTFIIIYIVRMRLNINIFQHFINLVFDIITIIQKCNFNRSIDENFSSI